MFCAESSEPLAQGIFSGGAGCGAACLRGLFHVFKIVDDSSCIVDPVDSRSRTLCSIYWTGQGKTHGLAAVRVVRVRDQQGGGHEGIG
ncbi:MAG: hypothetical protein RI897_107 [Verrucomicrobiota bacterium]|jgi:hypothetical protein